MITVYFDLDGVLADFVGGALMIHNRTDVEHSQIPWDMPAHLAMSPEAFWAPLGFAFWRDLEPHDDGMELFRRVEELVGRDRIALVSSPCQTAGCDEGKRAWVAKHLPGYERSLFLGGDKWKLAGPTKLLLDDHEGNLVKFRDAGGAAVRVPRPWNDGRHACVGGYRFVPDAVAAVVRGALHAAE